MLFNNYKSSHFLAIVSATAIHFAAGFWAMMPSSPTVINQQAIKVSFVAPSGSIKKSENDFKKKIITNLEEKSALKQQENKKEEQKNNSKSLAQGKETSGRVDEDALANKGAESDPVFNADYLNNPAPSYPRMARKRNLQGKVFVKVLVNIDGTPQNIIISKSSGHNILDEAALEAVKTWRFIPARKGNKTVQASVVIPVEFKII